MKALQLVTFLFLFSFSCVNQPSTNVGKIWAPEVRTFVDKKTNATVRQLTNYRGHSHHFYFTNPGWYNNGQKLLFSSDRNNKTNLFSTDLNTFSIQQLTDLELVPLPNEVEFLRACKNPVKEEAYFWHNLKLMALDLVTLKTRTLLEIDKGWCVSMTNCSADGKYVYCGIWEDQSDKFEVDLLRNYVGFTETWEAKPLSRIMRVATEGAGSEVVFEEKYWIGHVNTSPTRSDLITFCHEGPWNKVDNRIWCMNVETKEVWKIHPRAEEGESVGHEYWYADGETIGFHGRRGDKTFIGHARFDNTQSVEVDFPGKVVHIHSNDEKMIVADGEGIIRLWKWNGTAYEGPRMLCQAKSTMNIQQVHPHPRFNSAGTQVIFTCDVSGYGNVYLADIPDFNSLPLAEEK